MACHLEHCVTGRNLLHWELCIAKLGGKVFKKYGGNERDPRVTCLWCDLLECDYAMTSVYAIIVRVSSLLIILSRWRTQAYNVTCLVNALQM